MYFICSKARSFYNNNKMLIVNVNFWWKPCVQIPRDFNQFGQLEALLSSYPLRRHIMAILAILDWTLVVTTQLQMNWDIFNNTKKHTLSFCRIKSVSILRTVWDIFILMQDKTIHLWLVDNIPAHGTTDTDIYVTRL